MILRQYEISHRVLFLQSLYLLRIRVILLRMVRLVKNQEIDLINGDESMHETLIQDFGRADDDQILLEMLFPDPSMPKIATHVSTEAFDLLV